MSSLRDMGYDFAQAVADIIDNSVSARATRVSIDVEFDGDDSWVRITDNGKGMNPTELREALRYGSDQEYEDESLGKFGLGLKTASMSQCQRLSVASRWNRERANIAAYSWDLTHVRRTNRWEILALEAGRETERLWDPLLEHVGTVVLWERLDRILGYKHPYGELARKRIPQMCRELEAHLGMVFHRFLSGEQRSRPFRIDINGNQLAPWDPFCRLEPATLSLPATSLECEYEGVRGTITIAPFILPRQEAFSSEEAFRLAGGPRKWNAQQGFYTYRAGRLVQSGGWSHLRANDEHTKLARIAVHFDPVLDEAFKINVAKMRVQLPAVVREEVRRIVAEVTKQARQVYDRKASAPAGLHSSSTSSPKGPELPAGPADHLPNGSRNASHDLMSLSAWKALTIASATDRERPVILSVIDRIEASLEGPA